MTTLISYEFNPELNDQKTYGLVKNMDNTIWLVSTITNGDFLNWQLLKSFDQLIDINHVVLILIEMQIKANKIYIVYRDRDRDEKLNTSVLFIIPIEDVGNISDMAQYKYNLPQAVDDGDVNWQTKSSFLIQPTVNGADFYICAGNKILLSKDDKRDDWSTFHDFEDDNTLVMIKTGQDIMAVGAYDLGGALYLAPLGSTNFQKIELYDSDGKTGIYEVFFHLTNTSSGQVKIMTTFDTQGSVRTFTYEVGQDGIITVTPAYKEYRFVFDLDGAYPIGTPVAATEFGNKLKIGFMFFDNQKQRSFIDITIAKDATIAIKSLVDFQGGNESSEARTNVTIGGPTLYLDYEGNFYSSRDLGVTWQQEHIVFHPVTVK